MKYYLTAMLFIVFDIEIVFLYPWAVAFDSLGIFGLVEMVLFILTAARRLRLRLASRRARVGLIRVARGRWLTMGIEEKLPSGFLLTSVEKLAGYMRKGSLWPATFGLACCAIEMMATGGRPLRPGPLRHGGLPGLAAAGRPDDRRRPGQPEDGSGAAPDLRPDAQPEVGARRWASAPPPAACSTTTRSCRASTTSCPSTSTCRAARRGPEMLIDAILKLHEQIGDDAARRQPREGRPRGGGGRAERQADRRR